MVAPEQTSITTRLQARIDAHDERLNKITQEMSILSAAVLSIQENLQTFPEKMENMLKDLLKHQGTPIHTKSSLIFNEDGSVHVEPSVEPLQNTSLLASGSGPPKAPIAHLIHENHFGDPLFSLPKVKLPLFEGDDPRGWITKAELYFQLHQIAPPQKLRLTQMCMTGSALNWFTNLMVKHPNTTWDQFRSKLMVRFSGTPYLNAYEALGSLYQDGDVEEYIVEFEALSALISGQTEEQAVGMFLRGLRDEIRNWVRTLNPSTCDDAMDAARRIEIATHNVVAEADVPEGGYSGPLNRFPHNPSRQKYLRHSGPNSIRAHYLDNPSSQPIPLSAQSLIPPYGPKPGLQDAATPNRRSGIRHLSKQEWEDRRRKGLCFGCGQPYSPQHRCPEGALRILLLADGELVDDKGDVYNPDMVA